MVHWRQTLQNVLVKPSDLVIDEPVQTKKMYRYWLNMKIFNL
jgi:hypothetical protein